MQDDKLSTELNHEAQRIAGENGLSYIEHRGDMRVEWSHKSGDSPLFEFKPREDIVVLSHLKKRDARALQGRLMIKGLTVETQGEGEGPLTIQMTSLEQMQKLGDVIRSVLSPELKEIAGRR